MTARHPTKQQIARAFSLKASQYRMHALIQISLLNQLLPRIRNIASSDGLWADLGCGTGILEQRLGTCTPKVVGVDFAYGALVNLKKMVNTRALPVCADIDSPPFRNGSFEGVVAASVLQWAGNPEGNLKRVAELLRQDGYFVFSAFIKGSFREIYKVRSNRGLSIPLVFPDAGAFRDTLSEAGFEIIEQEEYWNTEYYPNARDALRSISGIGATAVAGQRMNRTELDDFCREYESASAGANGVPVTYRALLGTCVKKAGST